MNWDSLNPIMRPPIERAALLVACYLAPLIIYGLFAGQWSAFYARTDFLPTLTRHVLPLVPYTPVFALGAVPAVLVLVSRSLSEKHAIILLWLSAGILWCLITWMAILTFALYYPIMIMGNVA